MFNNNFRKNLNIFCRLWVVQSRYWSDNIMNLFLGIAVSLYTMVCWLSFKSGDPFLMVSGISVGIIRNGLHIYQKSLVDWRIHGTNQRLETLPIPKYVRAAATITFNLATTFGIALFMFIIAILCFPAQRDLLPHANGLMVISGFFMTWLVSYLMGTVIYLYVKNPSACQMIGLLIYTTSLNFLGLAFPIQVILNNGWTWMGDVLYLWPQRFSLNILQAGFANVTHAFESIKTGEITTWVEGQNYLGIMNIENFPLFNNDGTPVLDKNGLQKTLTVDFGFVGKAWIAYLGWTGWAMFYGLITIYKTIKNVIFHEKNEYGKFAVNQSTSRYIVQIKRAKSKEEIEMIHQSRIDELRNKSNLTKTIVDQVQREMHIKEYKNND
ncbi:ABC transporter permease [Williamsoniiplasma somnilux]|uniref:ABC transporter permease n=1 Tax=Williamsoniiplasma somnilux TaxID=215578 RepID=A0A2K8P0Z1_9MOLU|nr:hypothetical protein [Williamsoniiplasma somnilux]ATZ18671.1 ABC transporter permease [Williamsoniiplasma somnilux]